MTKRPFLTLPLLSLLAVHSPLLGDDPAVFGEKYPKLDGMATPMVGARNGVRSAALWLARAVTAPT